MNSSIREAGQIGVMLVMLATFGAWQNQDAETQRCAAAREQRGARQNGAAVVASQVQGRASDVLSVLLVPRCEGEDNQWGRAKGNDMSLVRVRVRVYKQKSSTRPVSWYLTRNTRCDVPYYLHNTLLDLVCAYGYKSEWCCTKRSPAPLPPPPRGSSWPLPFVGPPLMPTRPPLPCPGAYTPNL